MTIRTSTMPMIPTRSTDPNNVVSKARFETFATSKTAAHAATAIDHERRALSPVNASAPSGKTMASLSGTVLLETKRLTIINPTITAVVEARFCNHATKTAVDNTTKASDLTVGLPRSPKGAHREYQKGS